MQVDDLPQEVAELLDQHEQEKIVKLEMFSRMVAKKRDDAVNGRANSGIEQQWDEDDAHYNGVDAANAGKQAMYKPTSPTGGFVQKGRGDKNATRSTVFLNITRPYVDAIVARTCDILLPTDDKNWALQPTPIPELIAMKKDVPTPGPVVPQSGPIAPNPGMPAPIPAGVQQMGQPPAPPSMADIAQRAMDQARDACEKAEKQIEDWLAESGYNAENRKVVFDAAKLGTGIIKGPVPEKHKSMSINHDGGETKVSMNIEIQPGSKRVDPWNFFPDPSCGENIHDGNHCFERDYLTAKSLRDLKDLPGYLGKSIDEVLGQGPKGMAQGNFSTSKRTDDKDLYPVFYGYMDVGVKELEAAGLDVTKLKGDSISALVTLVNDTVIKAVPNPMDDGEFPYDVMPWQRVAGTWTGIGVSRQIRTPQQSLNAAHRNLLDNAGLSGGPILIVRRNMIEPADGDWVLRPRKIFYATADADIRSVNDAITAVNIPSMQVELMNIIQFELKVAELVTGFPLIMQGQNSQSAPDTYGGQILATNNASTVLRYIARVYDDSVTTKHIGRYYKYLLAYGEDESMKGDFEVVARGASVLVEKEIQAQEIIQLIGMSANPAFELDPAKLMAEYLKSRRFDARKFKLSEEQIAAAKATPDQPPVQVAVAQIKSAAEIQAAQIRAKGQVDVVTTEAALEQQAAESGHPSPQMAAAQARISEAQIRAASVESQERSRSATELAWAQNEAKMAADNHAANLNELAVRRDLEMLKYANQQKISLDQIKADLAKTSIIESTKESSRQPSCK